MRAARRAASVWIRSRWRKREQPLDRERVAIELEELRDRLARAGFVAAHDETEELLTASNGDEQTLDTMVQRRLLGEPLAWITGTALFCGLVIHVESGVYVPRWQSEPLARRAVERLSPHGIAVDLCTGSGAIAKTLLHARPEARVVASDLDGQAVSCASSNGVEVYRGDLFDPFPEDLRGRVDVVVSVAPYVPTPSLRLLPRDTFTFESTLSYDGGVDGVDILRRIVEDSTTYLRPGGALLLELGGDEADLLDGDLARWGFVDVATTVDDDGDVRSIEAAYNG
jgi:release factor glutamine methyltransferase